MLLFFLFFLAGFKRKCCWPAKVVFKCDIDGFVVRMRVASHPSLLYAFMDDARSYVCNDLLFLTRQADTLAVAMQISFVLESGPTKKIRSGPLVSSVSELHIFFRLPYIVESIYYKLCTQRNGWRTIWREENDLCRFNLRLLYLDPRISLSPSVYSHPRNLFEKSVDHSFAASSSSSPYQLVCVYYTDAVPAAAV